MHDLIRRHFVFKMVFRYGRDNPTLYCLIAKIGEIHESTCRREVQRVERQQAESIRFDPRTMRECYADIKTFCNDVS